MKREFGAAWVGLLLALIGSLSACAAGTMAPTGEPSPTAALPTTEPEEQMPAPTEEATVSPLPTPAPEMISPLETPEPTTGDEMNEADPTDEASDDAVVWLADGIISEGEYAAQADFGDIRVWWQHDGEFLYLAWEGDTTGWVSVGLNPENRMQGANYLFGYVADGIARLWDAYGTAPTSQHPPDAEIGGTDDIVTYTGEEENGVTRFEAQIPLDSGDPYDQALEAGKSYPMIVAIGDADDFDAYHRRYDLGELTLAP